MAKQDDRVIVQTPIFEAIYPSLNVADTHFKAEGEYHTKGRFDPSNPEHAGYIARVEELVDQAFQQAKDLNPKYAKVMQRVSPFKPELNDNGDETGFVVQNFKRVAQVTSKKTGKTYTFRVMLYDANLAPFPAGRVIGGGSKLRAAYEAYFYFSAKDKEAGVSARLEAVQVVEFKEYRGKGRGGEAFGFDTVRGGFDGTQLPASSAADEFAPAVPVPSVPASGARGDF